MTLISNPINFPAVFPYQEGDPHVKYGNAILTGNDLRVNPYAYMATTFKQTDENTLNTSLKIMQDLKFITKGLSVNALINFKNWSSSSYHRDKTLLLWSGGQLRTTSQIPTTFDLKLLDTGDQYITESGIGKSSDRTIFYALQINYARSSVCIM